jgi:Ser/Thr protein kinase RdoA (MazF antagonist)
MERLAGGNVADAVVRIGDTVRKPWLPSTPAVHAFMRHLKERGFAAVPEVLGRDDEGRQMLEYVPGTGELPRPDDGDLHRLGGLIRELHDLSASFAPPERPQWTVAIPADGADLICHQDLAPWNLIRDGDRWVFIDWDASAPGTRRWDLAYVAQSFVPMVAGGDPDRDAERLRILVDAYGLDDAGRRALPATLGRRTRAMYDLLRTSTEAPWTRLWAEGHGDHWGPAADYVEANELSWRRAVSPGSTG